METYVMNVPRRVRVRIPEDICKHLTHTNAKERLIDDCGRDYICNLNGRQCIACRIYQTDFQDYPIMMEWGKARINKSSLGRCPTWMKLYSKSKEKQNE